MSSDTPSLVFIISGPSGAGKSTLIRWVMERDPRLAFSVSHTTRPPRIGEVDGKDYYFIDRNTFEELISKGAFLEWAEVYGELYGTSRKEIDRLHQQGKDVILDIDVQGAKQVMDALERERWVSIFILPPDLETLQQRLQARGKDPEARIQRRLEAARREIDQSHLYDYRIINHRIDQSARELFSIIEKERRHKAGSPKT